MPVPGGEITTTEILVPEVVPVEETKEEEAIANFKGTYTDED